MNRGHSFSVIASTNISYGGSHMAIVCFSSRRADIRVRGICDWQIAIALDTNHNVNEE